MVISFDNSYTIFVISASRKTPDTVNAPCHFDAVITILVSHVRPIIFALFILAMCHSCYIYDPSQLVAAISTHLCWLCHSLSVAAWIGSTNFTKSAFFFTTLCYFLHKCIKFCLHFRDFLVSPWMYCFQTLDKMFLTICSLFFLCPRQSLMSCFVILLGNPFVCGGT